MAMGILIERNLDTIPKKNTKLQLAIFLTKIIIQSVKFFYQQKKVF